MKNNLKLVLAGLLLAGSGGVFWLGQQPMPMEPEQQSGLVAGDEIAQVKAPAELTSLAQMGKRAFGAKCAVCHGKNAGGRVGKAPPLVHPYYRPSHHADAAFFLAAENGVRAHHWRFGNMPAIEGITRGDIKGIVAYVRELQRENGIN